MKKRLLSLLIAALCLIQLVCPAYGEEPEVHEDGSWKYVISEETGTIEIIQYIGKDSAVSVPEQIGGIAVTAIGDRAFFFDYNRSCYNLTSITIPDSVTSIGNYAFAYSENLTSITIPDSVSSIGINPFQSTPVKIIVSPKHPYFAVIDGVLFDKQNKRLVSYPYGNKASSYEIPKGILEIGDYAFSYCKNLTSITIPDSVTSIGDGAFSFWHNLTSITIPDSVTSIGNHAFSSCTNLTSITIPDSVTSIGDEAFEGCENLTITVTEDSYAEQYCIDNQLEYTLTNALDWLYS